MASGLGLISSTSFGERNNIQSVKSACSICIQSLTPASYPFSREIMTEVKRTHTKKSFFFLSCEDFTVWVPEKGQSSENYSIFFDGFQKQSPAVCRIYGSDLHTDTAIMLSEKKPSSQYSRGSRVEQFDAKDCK